MQSLDRHACATDVMIVLFLVFLSIANRGVPESPRGWSVSLLAEDSWTDLIGCDFVMDLLAGVESDAPDQPFSHPDYLFSNDG